MHRTRRSVQLLVCSGAHRPFLFAINYKHVGRELVEQFVALQSICCGNDFVTTLSQIGQFDFEKWSVRVKVSWDKKMVEIEIKRDAVRAKLVETGQSSKEAWEEVRKGAQAGVLKVCYCIANWK